MAMSRELDVSPWEALTMAVRIAAARVAWVDEELRQATLRHDGEPTDHHVLELLQQSRHERKLLATTAKSAIDAGVAERLVRQVELEGKVLADALDVALTAAGLDEAHRLLALEAAHRRLVATVGAEDGAWAVPGTASPPLGASDVERYVDRERGPESGTDGPDEERT